MALEAPDLHAVQYVNIFIFGSSSGKYLSLISGRK
jgi:hypothetical protein